MWNWLRVHGGPGDACCYPHAAMDPKERIRSVCAYELVCSFFPFSFVCFKTLGRGCPRLLFAPSHLSLESLPPRLSLLSLLHSPTPPLPPSPSGGGADGDPLPNHKIKALASEAQPSDPGLAQFVLVRVRPCLSPHIALD